MSLAAGGQYCHPRPTKGNLEELEDGDAESPRVGSPRGEVHVAVRRRQRAAAPPGDIVARPVPDNVFKREPRRVSKRSKPECGFAAPAAPAPEEEIEFLRTVGNRSAQLTYAICLYQQQLASRGLGVGGFTSTSVDSAQPRRTELRRSCAAFANCAKTACACSRRACLRGADYARRAMNTRPAVCRAAFAATPMMPLTPTTTASISTTMDAHTRGPLGWTRSRSSSRRARTGRADCIATAPARRPDPLRRFRRPSRRHGSA